MKITTKKNLIVFDIDDTITQSGSQHHEAFINTMIHFGFSQINTNWQSYQHKTDSFILKVNYNKNFNRDFNFSFVDRFENIMVEKLRQQKTTPEITGASRVVKLLEKQTNYALAFATGSLKKPAILKLEQAYIPYNEKLISTSNTSFRKEEIVKNAINKAKTFYNVDAFERIIVVGDGVWDFNTAKKMGLHFLGIGLKNYAAFKSNDIKAHIKDWTEFDLGNVERKIWGNKAAC